MTKKTSTAEWQERIEEQSRSGKSQAAWCREKKISIKSFGYWSRKLRNNENSSKPAEINWIPVSIEAPITSKLNIRVGSAVIEVEKGFDEMLLSEVVKVLSGIC